MLLAPMEEERVVLMLPSATKLAAAVALLQRLFPMEEAIATLSLQMERTVQPLLVGSWCFRRNSLRRRRLRNNTVASSQARLVSRCNGSLRWRRPDSNGSVARGELGTLADSLSVEGDLLRTMLTLIESKPLSF